MVFARNIFGSMVLFFINPSFDSSRIHWVWQSTKALCYRLLIVDSVARSIFDYRAEFYNFSTGNRNSPASRERNVTGRKDYQFNRLFLWASLINVLQVNSRGKISPWKRGPSTWFAFAKIRLQFAERTFIIYLMARAPAFRIHFISKVSNAAASRWLNICENIYSIYTLERRYINFKGDSRLHDQYSNFVSSKMSRWCVGRSMNIQQNFEQ